jgi:hypothetical protein
MSSRAWTNHEVKKLKELHATGMSNYEIGQNLNRTKGSIECQCISLMANDLLPRRTRMQRIKINQRARARSDAERYRQVCAP